MVSKVSSSSILELQGIVLDLKDNPNKVRLKIENNPIVVEKVGNKGVEDRNYEDLEEFILNNEPENKILKKLEEKAKLYDSLMNDKVEIDEKNISLVDFSLKKKVSPSSFSNTLNDKQHVNYTRVAPPSALSNKYDNSSSTLNPPPPSLLDFSETGDSINESVVKKLLLQNSANDKKKKRKREKDDGDVVHSYEISSPTQSTTDLNVSHKRKKGSGDDESDDGDYKNAQPINSAFKKPRADDKLDADKEVEDFMAKRRAHREAVERQTKITEAMQQEKKKNKLNRKQEVDKRKKEILQAASAVK